MDLKAALAKLEEMLDLAERIIASQGSSAPQVSRQDYDRFTMLYGEVEDVIHQFDGLQNIKVDNWGAQPSAHKDWVSAAFLSGRTFHFHQGRTQLVKVIGKVRSALENPGVPEAPASIDQLLRALRRFRECCQFIESPPATERQVQDIIWIMLRSQFDRLDREESLPKFGVKAYKPDFGVPDLRTLIEVKYVGHRTEVASIQEEILADVPGYLKDNQRYAGLVVFVYDAAHKLRDSRKFTEDLRSVEGISDVIVVPGIGV